MIRCILVILTIVALIGCGPSTEYEQAKKRLAEVESENAELRRRFDAVSAELEELKFGPERLLSQAKSAVDSENDSEAIRVIDELLKRHPGSNEAKVAAALKSQVEAKIASAEQRRKREEDRKREETRLALERATRNMKKKTDEIEGITWVSHRNAPVLAKYATLYFGSDSNGSARFYPIRLRVQYYADDWLFVDSLTIKADDRTYELRGLDFKRDNSSGSIWEWTDIPVTDHAMITQLLSAKRVIIRFHGNQYYSDLTLPKSQQDQMREVYSAWQSMGGRP